MATLAEALSIYGDALTRLSERVDELERLETYYGTLDLNGHTLTLTGDLSLTGGTMTLNGHTLTLNSDLTFNSGTAGRLAGYTATGTLDDATVAKTGSGVLTFNAAGAYTFTITSTGTIDLNSNTLTVNSNSTLDLGGNTLTYPLATGAIPNLDASKITTGTLNTARLGSGTASANTLLHGDSTWSQVILTAEVSGILPIANGGTGASTASGALSNLGAVTGPNTGSAVNGLAFYNGANSISYASGLYWLSGNLHVPGSITATNTISTSSTFSASGAITSGSNLNAAGAQVSGGACAYYFNDRSGSPNWALYAQSGTARIWNSSTGDVLTINTSGNGWIKGTSWSYGSDRSLKQNIVPLPYGLDALLRLDPVQFDYIDGDARQFGFVAQDLQPVIPELVVSTERDGQPTILSLRTTNLVPVLVRGIQELAQRLHALEQRAGGTP